MPEFIKTAEVIGNIAEKAYKVGKFVVSRFQGGAWGETADQMEVPVKANLTYFGTGETE